MGTGNILYGCCLVWFAHSLKLQTKKEFSAGEKE
jgi:hypothetical protein